jgi:transposase
MDKEVVKQQGAGVRYFSEAFKRQVCEEYVRGTATKMDIQRKYNIKFKSALITWLRNFGFEEKPKLRTIQLDNTPQQLMAVPPKETQEQLARRVKELEKQLEEAQLRAMAYSTMIDIAEKELKIDIRKKSDTKQSRE